MAYTQLRLFADEFYQSKMTIKPLYDMPASDSKKLPTLKQFLSKRGKAPLPAYYPVTLVWEPNQFPNWTIQTEYFKVRISEDNPFYKALAETITTAVREDMALGVSISEDLDGKWALVHISTEKADWEGLGASGWKITIQEKAKKKS